MVALLMLGIIPGTNIQIDFIHWLGGIEVLAVLCFLYSIHHRRAPSMFIISMAFYYTIVRTKLSSSLA